MKKSLVILLMTSALVLSGCQKNEEEVEIIVPPAAELSVEEKTEISSE